MKVIRSKNKNKTKPKHALPNSIGKLAWVYFVMCLALLTAPTAENIHECGLAFTVLGKYR